MVCTNIDLLHKKICIKQILVVLVSVKYYSNSKDEFKMSLDLSKTFMKNEPDSKSLVGSGRDRTTSIVAAARAKSLNGCRVFPSMAVPLRSRLR